MPWWMKYALRGQADDAGVDGGGGIADDGGDGGGAVDEPAALGDGDGGNGGGISGADDAPKTGAALTDGMLKEIQKGLAEGAEAGTDRDGAGKPVDATAKGKEAGTEGGKKAGEADAGKPDGDVPGAGDKGKKQRTADDYALNETDRKHLGPKAIGRHHELIKYAKTVEAERETFRQQNEQLSQARDAIVSAMRETQTDAEDLTQLLHFNGLIKTGKYDDALSIIESYRTSLLKHLGREGSGYDPLAEHPDLVQSVAEQKMAREAALEVVQARALQNRTQQERNQQEMTHRQQQEAQAVQDRALQSIGAWNQQMAASDPAFSDKARILEPKLKDIMSRYAPQYWPQAIQDAYDAIQVAPAAPMQRSAPRDEGTLRPTGARPGAAAPSNMLQALQRGLGYSAQ